ncbi:hypothetical protein PMKS-003487 [Pichia membranifaciens]|uniref:Uncharacterized protein n=1 Tax=Pichia membranifaciens TaxID=4926 RepID=A0A1Q2YKH9_9ASCO|nr:hypothetical protein PMKS-003487 [Pichia membranifaciens]
MGESSAVGPASSARRSSQELAEEEGAGHLRALESEADELGDKQREAACEHEDGDGVCQVRPAADDVCGHGSEVDPIDAEDEPREEGEREELAVCCNEDPEEEDEDAEHESADDGRVDSADLVGAEAK